MRMSHAKIKNGWRSIAGSTRGLLALEVIHSSIFLFKKVNRSVFTTLYLSQCHCNSISHHSICYGITPRATIQDSMKWIVLGLAVHLVAAGGTGKPAVSKIMNNAPCF